MLLAPVVIPSVDSKAGGKNKMESILLFKVLLAAATSWSVDVTDTRKNTIVASSSVAADP